MLGHDITSNKSTLPISVAIQLMGFRGVFIQLDRLEGESQGIIFPSTLTAWSANVLYTTQCTAAPILQSG